MFVYDNYLGNSYRIEEQNIIVGRIDAVGIVLNIIERPQLEIRIMVHKNYANNPNILYKYKNDILELLEYETGVYMPIKSGSIRDNFDYWEMYMEIHYPY
jgi:hypothetical protein